MPNPYTTRMLRQMHDCAAKGGKVFALTNGPSTRVHDVTLVPDATDDGPYFSGTMGGGTPVRFTAFHTSCD